MNLLFFLTPKSEVAYIYDDFTVRQTLEKMEYHQYAAVPIINKDGLYMGTLTEGDLLWGIKNQYNLDLKAAENVSIMEIKRRLDNAPVSINANMEDLISKALRQNFVPVVDDNGVFIGLVTRKEVMSYCYRMLKEDSTKVKVDLQVLA